MKNNLGITTIKKIKYGVRLVSVINSVLILIVFFTFAVRWRYLVSVMTPLIWCAIYLFFYPLFTIEHGKTKEKICNNNFIEMPVLPTITAITLCFFSTSVSNIHMNLAYYIFCITLLLILSTVFIVVLWKKEGAVSVKKSIYFIAVCVLYVYVMAYPINWLCRIKEPIHEVVTVTDMRRSNGRYQSYYYLKIDASNKKYEEVEVGSALFRKVEVGDTVILCKRHSIFQITYWTAHL